VIRIKISLLFLLLPLWSYGQFDFDVYQYEFVECFYNPEATEPLQIFDQVNGQIIVELPTITEDNCYYKLAISKSNNSWLRIENLMQVVNCSSNELNNNIHRFKGKWVQARNLMINISDLDLDPTDAKSVRFYQLPDRSAKVVYFSGKYLATDLLEIKERWAKVSFQVYDINYTGWLHRDDQCPYPWTTCPRN